MDKKRVVPLYLLHQKRFYDWFGNKSLQATVDMVADKPREKWRYILKKMCKIGVVDHEYIRHTCDMRWVTEECLMDETERYTRRYSNRKVSTDVDTSISSIGYESVVSVSQKTQSTHTEISEVKREQQLSDQLKKLDEERKKFREEQASLLLAQQLQSKENLCKKNKIKL
jgi:N-acetylmuramoyl-L-alanine amidase CwlA